jgi:hypothetical protein
MPHTLLCPNQLQLNGLVVNDTPKMFDSNFTQSIIIPGKLELPLRMRGILMYIATRRPTERELSECDRFELTSSNNWEPNLVGVEGNGTAEVPVLTSKRDPLELRDDFTSHVSHQLPRIQLVTQVGTRTVMRPMSLYMQRKLLVSYSQ